MINKIFIVGFSGAGKSTLASRIENELRIPHVRIDKHCLLPGKKMRPVEEVEGTLKSICAKDKWIIDGLYYNFSEQFLKEADMVVFIDIGVLTNTKNVLKRKIKHILLPKHKTGDEAVRKIHFTNTRRIWTDRKGFRKRWLDIIESQKDQIAFVKINKVNKKTSRQVIKKIVSLNS